MNQSEWLSQLLQKFNEFNGAKLTVKELLAIPPGEAFKPKKIKPPTRSRAESQVEAQEKRRATRRKEQANAEALVKEYRAITSIDGLVLMLKEKKLKTHQGKPFNRERVKALLKDIDGKR